MSKPVQPTPGEWKVDPDYDHGENITIETWEGESAAPIAQVYGTDEFPCLDHDDESKIEAIQAENFATAHVMAASKELLVACLASDAVEQHYITCQKCGGDLRGQIWFCSEHTKLASLARELTLKAIAKATNQQGAT